MSLRGIGHGKLDAQHATRFWALMGIETVTVVEGGGIGVAVPHTEVSGFRVNVAVTAEPSHVGATDWVHVLTRARVTDDSTLPVKYPHTESS
jgi:hypothetical protein